MLLDSFTIVWTTNTGMKYCLKLLGFCDEMWVFGCWQESRGCKREVAFCDKYDIPYQIVGDKPWHKIQKDNERLKKKKTSVEVAGRKAVNESYLKYVEIVNTSVNKDADWKRGKHLVYICNQIQEFIEKDTGNAYDIMILSIPLKGEINK